MKKRDELTLLLDALKKREQVLIKGQSMRKYNKYFDAMRKYARILIDNNRQDELLPYLESDSISIRCDVAGLLYHCYPERCRQVKQEIADMTVKTGLPFCFINVSVSAAMSLEIGIPKDFP